MSVYPKYKYHQVRKARLVHSEQAEKELGPEWADSPANFGVETHPGIKTQQEIDKELDAALMAEAQEAQEKSAKKSKKEA